MKLKLPGKRQKVKKKENEILGTAKTRGLCLY